MSVLVEAKDTSEFINQHLCFITKACVNFVDKSLNKDFNGLVLWFTENPLTIKGENISDSYSCVVSPPYIDRVYYIMYIEDFMTEELNGIEHIIYQRDNWCTSNDLYKSGSNISIKLINHGAGCWLYNKKTLSIINSSHTILDVLKIFERYKITIYKVY